MKFVTVSNWPAGEKGSRDRGGVTDEEAGGVRTVGTNDLGTDRQRVHLHRVASIALSQERATRETNDVRLARPCLTFGRCQIEASAIALLVVDGLNGTLCYGCERQKNDCRDCPRSHSDVLDVERRCFGREAPENVSFKIFKMH